jgi:hypothetical protein
MEDYTEELFEQLRVLVELSKAGDIDGAPRQFSDAEALLREINPDVHFGDGDDEPEERAPRKKVRTLDREDSDEEEPGDDDHDDDDEEEIKELPF